MEYCTFYITVYKNNLVHVILITKHCIVSHMYAYVYFLNIGMTNDIFMCMYITMYKVLYMYCIDGGKF